LSEHSVHRLLVSDWVLLLGGLHIEWFGHIIKNVVGDCVDLGILVTVTTATSLGLGQ
jgi:hypothetical protein